MVFGASSRQRYHAVTPRTEYITYYRSTEEVTARYGRSDVAFATSSPGPE
jgi:hypothetical protein